MVMELLNIIEKEAIETKEHVYQVQLLTEKLLNEYKKKELSNLSPQLIDHIVKYSILHDIGKASIPERILYKKGPLTTEERTLVETHPTEGMIILEKFGKESLTNWEVAKNLVLHHHEKWDGTGYPMRKKGLDIPFEARVLILVDVYDALTSKRSYKEAWGKEEAVSYIRANKGVYFDPILTDTFLTVLEKEEKDRKETE